MEKRLKALEKRLTALLAFEKRFLPHEPIIHLPP